MRASRCQVGRLYMREQVGISLTKSDSNSNPTNTTTNTTTSLPQSSPNHSPWSPLTTFLLSSPSSRSAQLPSHASRSDKLPQPPGRMLLVKPADGQVLSAPTSGRTRLGPSMGYCVPNFPNIANKFRSRYSCNGRCGAGCSGTAVGNV